MNKLTKAFKISIMNVGLGLTFFFILTILTGAIYYIRGVALTLVTLGFILVCFIIGAIIRRVFKNA